MSNVVRLPIVRAAPAPFGLYVHAGRNDHQELANAILGGRTSFFGVVVDATNDRRHTELRAVASDRRLDVLLEPQMFELSTPSGFNERTASLPWAGSGVDTPSSFDRSEVVRRSQAIARKVVEGGYSAVLAPTHLIEEEESPWIDIDAQLVEQLRSELDAAGRMGLPIMYPLLLQGAVFRKPDLLAQLADRLGDLPIEAIWLRLNGIGSDATPAGFLHAARAASILGAAKRPIVGDKIGGLPGLGLIAFGAVGGIGHGVTLGERCSLSSLLREPTGAGFSPPPRVYVPGLDMMLTRQEAQTFFQARGALHRFVCRDARCCPRGHLDMIENPRRHFINQRCIEVTEQAQIPSHLRPSRFLEDRVRPLSDNAAYAERLNFSEGLEGARLTRNRKRLENFRQVLGREVDRMAEPAEARLPEPRVVREARR